MVDRHAVQEMLRAGMNPDGIARHFGISRRTVRRIRKEDRVREVDDAVVRRDRGVGRPGVQDEIRERMRQRMEAAPEAPRQEILRQLRDEGLELGQSTFYRLWPEVRGQIPQELMVRFEGVAGEFAQFDFGEVDVRLPEGRTQRVHFAAFRLKYSRWVGVTLVPDERAESLIRALLTSFAQSVPIPAKWTTCSGRSGPPVPGHVDRESERSDAGVMSRVVVG